MSTKTLVSLIDDIDGSEATETVTFNIDGTGYEIDLNESNAERLRKTLAAYITAGRRTRTQAQARPGRRVRSADNGDVREWAASAGITVAPRGRIPANVTDAYRAAMVAQRRAQAEPGPIPFAAPGEPERPAEPPAPADSGPDENTAIREWAAQHGHDVKPRGRIPADVRAAYREAHN